MTILYLIAKVLVVWFVLSVFVGLALGMWMSKGQQLVEPQDDEERV